MYFEGANALKHGEIIFVIIVFDIVEWRIDITTFHMVNHKQGIPKLNRLIYHQTLTYFKCQGNLLFSSMCRMVPLF